MSEEHEMEELQEAAEHGREHSNLAPVSFTMAILAVLVAIAALLSHRAHTEEVLLQNKATDQWGYYQAKNIRRHTMEQVDELLKVLPLKDAAAAEAWLRRTRRRSKSPRVNRTKIQEEAKALEARWNSVNTSRQPLRSWRNPAGGGPGHLLDYAADQGVTLLDRRNRVRHSGSGVYRDGRNAP